MDYRYHCYIPADPGRNELPFNPCRLLDFTFLKLDGGHSWSGESGDREMLAVVLGGRAHFTVGSEKFPAVGGRPNVFSGKPHSVYIPAGTTVTIEAAGPVEIALPSAPSELDVPPYVIEPARVAAGRWGAANFGRNYHQILTEIAQPELPASRLIVGETYTPSGNWSTYPPHRHKLDNLPGEAAHEEMYYFRVQPGDGFGICRMYTDEGYEENFTVRDHGMHMMPEGYHTVVSAPGYTTYYVSLSWVGRTVPMIRDLGH